MPEPLAVIYALSCTCHPEKGIRYVGQTRVGFEKRWLAHLQDLRRRPSIPLYRWITKHGRENIAHRILEACPSPLDLSRAERAHIAALRATGADLLNRTRGGEGMLGLEVSEATREKLSAANRGEKHWSRRHPEKFAEHLSNIHSPDARSRAAKTMRARGNAGGASEKWTAEDRNRLANHMRGKPNPKRKINEEIAETIRTRARAGESQAALAAEFGISRQLVSGIKTGALWPEVTATNL